LPLNRELYFILLCVSEKSQNQKLDRETYD
jgi:hypothetical protein